MRTVVYLFVIAIGSLVPVKGVEWVNPVLQMKRVRAAVRDRTAKVRTSMIKEVKTADIRLMRKDVTKTAESHPLLPSANIDMNHATSMFETGWVEFYTWVSDLDTEYEPVDKADRLFFSKHYNSSLDTLFILHDRCGNARDYSVLKVIEALKLRNFDVHFNIIMMDFNKFMCKTISPNTGLFKIGFNPQLQLLATEIGGFIFKGIKKHKIRAEQMNLIGLGLSTHLAALVAKQTRKLSGEKLKSILGVDPPTSIRRSLLDRGSAQYIHIYHTFKLVPGTGPRTGHATADFVFGGAKRGPQCKKSITSSCFKEFGVQLFVSTLLYPKLFPGRWCPDYHKFSEHFCDTNDYAYVSFPPDKSVNGTYQLDINYQFPFGKGFDGIYQKEEEDEETPGGSEEVAKLSVKEYHHRLEVEVSRIRSDMVSCLHRVVTPTAAMRCVMAAQPSVRRMVRQHLIRKISCQQFKKFPTGKKCRYETRTRNTFDLPF